MSVAIEILLNIICIILGIMIGGLVVLDGTKPHYHKRKEENLTWLPYYITIPLDRWGNVIKVTTPHKGVVEVATAREIEDIEQESLDYLINKWKQKLNN